MRMILVVSIILAVFGCTNYTVKVAGYGELTGNTVKEYSFDLSKDIKTDLEAMGYVNMLEKRLACIGWKRIDANADYVIAPAFGIFQGSIEKEPRTSVGIGFGTGSYGGGFGLGTFFGTSTRVGAASGDFTKFLDVRLFSKGKTDSTPLWQGKIYIEDSEEKLSVVMPVLVEYAVQNFGKSTNGEKEFTFNATDKSLKAITECTVE